MIRKDGQGNVVRRSETFDTCAQAEKYAAQQDIDLERILQTQGGFEVGSETITVAEALKFHAEHYKGKASFKENGYRITHLAEWLGGTKKLRDLTTKDFKALRKKLQDDDYSASSQRNYFTVLTSLYKHAIGDWDYPVTNLVSGMNLPRPAN